ncbi:hypothetical protein [Sphingorhabdus sp. YGSMI21]|uniref:hypothetical protein n=1 Tax=Sphingorhabdus sp. YGSMI21 TaxID=2077182 RepID=UPI000C1EB7AD|nr:hypothetical protein [Sphingorhabdus sp. YGSMI21]ATW04547.1 hypothetical protein CHN51_14140 [Sphingorhabdus sp. YGSMI21]
MLKESILLVASTGLLIYFITPKEEPPKTAPVAAEVQEMAPPVAPVSDDSWEEDDSEDSDYENFVFGEPMTVAGSEGDDPWDEDHNPSLQYQADKSPSKSRSSVGEAPPLAGSPRPGEPGSQQNPIERSEGSGED